MLWSYQSSNKSKNFAFAAEIVKYKPRDPWPGRQAAVWSPRILSSEKETINPNCRWIFQTKLSLRHFWIFYSSGVRGCKGKWKRKWHHQPLCHFVYFLYVLSNFNHSEFWRSSECVLHIITHCVIRVLPDLHVSPCKANSFIQNIVNICSILEICVMLTQCLKHFYLFLDKLDKRAKAGEKWSKHAGKQFDQWSFKATSSKASFKN